MGTNIHDSLGSRLASEAITLNLWEEGRHSVYAYGERTFFVNGVELYYSHYYKSNSASSKLTTFCGTVLQDDSFEISTKWVADRLTLTSYYVPVLFAKEILRAVVDHLSALCQDVAVNGYHAISFRGLGPRPRA